MRASRQAPTSRPGPSLPSAPHPRLLEAVRKHLAHGWHAPIPAHTARAFDFAARQVASEARPLVLDSGCGTGESSARLAAGHPDCWVIGIDRSAARLARRLGDLEFARFGNLVLVRAELAAFWQLASSARWRLAAHYLLYPNPWPKSVHYLRRWHAHPAFPQLLRLGGALDARANRRVYLEELALALDCAGTRAAIDTHAPAQDEILSPFERKYRLAAQPLWRLRADLR